jgi:predicted PhzF superfamily epimerase YddE/YHI9
LVVDITSDDGMLFMDFPADSITFFQRKVLKEEVAEAIGLSKEQKCQVVDIIISERLRYVVIEVENSIDIASLKVNPFKLVLP